jgi:hypothetical protein
MRNIVFKCLTVLLGVCTLVNLCTSLQTWTSGAPLTYWDLATLTAVPSGFAVALIAGVLRFGLSFSLVGASVWMSMTGLFVGAILPSIFHLSAGWAVLVNVAFGVTASLAHMMNVKTHAPDA